MTTRLRGHLFGGPAAMVMKMLKLPDGRVKILVQGLAKGIIKEYLQEKLVYHPDSACGGAPMKMYLWKQRPSFEALRNKVRKY